MNRPISDKKSVRILIDLFRSEGITDIVISPGSRNAPLIISFTALNDYFNCFSVVDERSAAFFALGIAQQKNKIVALVCTSGTAMLNYAPAIAEAYYQNIPLVVVSADRPGEWIDQADGQTIQQHNIYGNYIKYSCTLPVEINSEEDEWYTERLISEAFLNCKKSLSGPVHINVPLREPLYGRTVHQIKKRNVVSCKKSVGGLLTEDLNKLADAWSGTERIMILMGMMKPDTQIKEVLEKLAERERVVILTETLSNCQVEGSIRCIDRVLAGIRDEEAPLYKPDLLITFDGNVVSKNIKTFLKQNPPKEHWHISKAGQLVDTYMHLSRILEGESSIILEQLMHVVKPVKSRFKENWKKRFDHVSLVHDEYVKTVQWSDFKAFNEIVNNLPRPSVVQLGNSTPVRYAQLFDNWNDIESYSNRGTSGIDGSVSTSVGAAVKREEPVVLIAGDLSFLYDSNALWKKQIPNNLKIIILNNSGGGIFRFIPGSSDADELEEYFATTHDLNAENIAKQFNVDYQRCDNFELLKEKLPAFFEKKHASILEVMTPSKSNSKILKDYFAGMKK